MPAQHFGEYTRLVPPIVIDGVLYGMAIKFSRAPTNQPSPVKILSGQVVSSTKLASSLRRIVCKRGAQTSSYTVVPGGGSRPFEVTYRCQTGGNICHTTERDRVNNFANQMNYGGPDFGTRLRAGDVLVLREGERVKRYTITETDAFGQAPDEVDWQGRDPLPTVQYVAMDNYAVQMVAGDGQAFSIGEAAPFNETGAYAGATELTRKIFNSDPDSYESDADLAVNEYWYGPETGVFYFGEMDTATVEVYYWQVGFEEMQAASLQKVVIECTEESTPLGIDTTSDEIALSSEFYLGEFSEVFALEFGTCVLEYRSTLQAASRVVGIEVNVATQTVVDAYQRSADDGTVASVTFATYTPDPWGLFRVRRVGTALFIEQAVAGEWEIVKEFVIDFGPGFLSVGSTGQAKFYVFPKESDDAIRTRSLGRLGVDGRQSRRVSTAPQSYRRYTAVNLQSGEPIEEIKLLRGDVDEEVPMFFRGTLAGGKRNSYHKDEQQLFFYPEANADRIRVTYAAPSASPPKPGSPPKVEGVEVLNFGTRVDGSPNPGVATTNVSQNRGNWHDVVIFHDPHDDGDTVPGDLFDGERGGFASSQLPPSFHIDIRNGDGDWTLIPLADRLWYAPEGILLIKESVRAGIDGNPCVRATFTESGGRCGAILNEAGIDAQQINELAQGIATMQDLWVPVLLEGGANVGVSGSTPLYGIGSRTYDCSMSARPVSRTLGMFGSSFTTWAEDGRPNPHWLTSGGGPRLNGATGAFDFMTAAWRDIQKCVDVVGPTNGSTVQTGVVSWEVDPYGRAGGASVDYVGSVPPNGIIFETSSAFSFSGYSIGLDPMMMRMLRGATCIEARARVKVDGLKYLDWNWRRKTSTADGVLIDDYAVNGTTFVGASVPSVAVLLSDYATATGGVAFRLVGRRRITRQIVTFDGATQAVLDGEYRTFGGTIAGSTLEAGKWGMVDVTNAINSMLKMKDSTVLEYYLWPSVGGASPQDEPASLGGYISGQIASGSGGWTYDDDTGEAIVDDTMSGSYMQFTGFAISGIWARFSMPGTELNDMWLPMFMPPQAPEFTP